MNKLNLNSTLLKASALSAAALPATGMAAEKSKPQSDRPNIVVIVAGGCSMLLMAPLFAASMTEPATLASFFGGLVLCYALVSIGAFASNHVAASLNLTDYRADD